MSSRIQASRKLTSSQVEGEARVVKVPVWARAREYTDEVLGYWVRTMRDADQAGPVRMKASENIMDRAWGKAPVLIATDDAPALRIDIRELDGDRMDALEAALMGAIAPGSFNSLPQTGAIIEGAIVPDDTQTPASGLDKALTKGERISTAPEFALCSQDDRQLAYERQLSEPVLQGGGEGTSDRAEHELSADRGEA